MTASSIPSAARATTRHQSFHTKSRAARVSEEDNGKTDRFGPVKSAKVRNFAPLSKNLSRYCEARRCSALLPQLRPHPRTPSQYQPPTTTAPSTSSTLVRRQL